MITYTMLTVKVDPPAVSAMVHWRMLILTHR